MVLETMNNVIRQKQRKEMGYTPGFLRKKLSINIIETFWYYTSCNIVN